MLPTVHSDIFVVFFFFKERIQLETSRLYKQAGVNPLAGMFFNTSLNICWKNLCVSG